MTRIFRNIILLALLNLWAHSAGAQSANTADSPLAGYTPVTDEMLKNPPAEDWLMWRSYGLSGHSPLRQINRDNVQDLERAFCVPLNQGGFIVGLDLESGEEQWRFYTLARPDEPGGNTWNNLPLEGHSGGQHMPNDQWDLDQCVSRRDAGGTVFASATQGRA